MITVSSRSRSSHEALNQSPSRKRTREGLEARVPKATYSYTGAKGRGRGRPVTTGARAEKLLRKEAAKQARKEARDEEALQGVLEWSHKVAMAKSRAEYYSRELTVSELVQNIRTSCDTVYFAADKSRNLKWTFVKAIKDSIAVISGAVETIVARTQSDEIRRLSAQNETLKLQVEELRKELLALRVERNTAAVPA